MASNSPSRKIGSMDCVCCGETMPVRQNGRDTLNVSCPWCGFSAYAKGDTEAHRIVSKWVRVDAAKAPQPEESAPVASTPAPSAPAPAASVKKLAQAFSLGDL